MIIGVINFCSRCNYLIYRKLIELNIQAKLFNPNTPVDEVERRYDGIVISGGSFMIPQDLDKVGNVVNYIKKSSKPILGICLGHQLIAYIHGSELTNETPEFSEVMVYVDNEDDILQGLNMRKS